ncbi:MAG TPA: carboxypeptidase-like regulatory domain-containing protein [Terriglobales bacterium]
MKLLFAVALGLSLAAVGQNPATFQRGAALAWGSGAPKPARAQAGGAAAPRQAPRPFMSYEVEVPPVAGAPAQAALEVSRIRGRAHDDVGNSIATVGLGLFTADANHQFITMVITDNQGKFDFGQAIPAGNYRLVAKYPGSCTANIPITVNRRAHHSTIDLTMEYPGLDLCSSARVR